jgi:hypothetical protein
VYSITTNNSSNWNTAYTYSQVGHLPLAGGAITGAITTNSTFDGRDVSVDGTKLDGIETNATADQTDAEIRTAVEAATDSNVFTDADHTKLNAIEASATADQTAAEIRVLVEAATDSNVFTDADHTKLNAIEASADVTDTTNVTAAGALMDSEVTNLADVKAFDTTDYATAAQGTLADSAQQPPSEGAFANGDKTKLDGIAAGAEVNVQSDWSSTSGDNLILNKPSIPSITGLATETYVDTAVSDLVDSSPATLNTLNELAAALGDDPNFATTTATSIGTKLPLAGGTLTGGLTITQNSGSLQFTNTGSGHASIATGSSKDLNISSASGTVYVNSNSTFTGSVLINSNDGLTIHTTTDAVDAKIVFSSLVPGQAQKGTFAYNHANSLSYGSDESFVISGTESTMTILADGKLMYNEGIYSKPASGTGAGTRKDSNWDTAYTYSQVGHLPLAGGNLTGNLGIANNKYITFGSYCKIGEDIDNQDALTIEGHSTESMYFTNSDNSVERLVLTGAGTATFAGQVNATRFILPSTGTTTPVNHYIFTDNTNTGTGSMTIQAGGGSAAYGGGLKLYSHSHATKPGWVQAGISSGSGGKFTVNTQGIGGGSDVFMVDANGTTINGASQGLSFLGGNNRIYFNGHRALEGATDGSILQIGEGYNTIRIQDTTLIKYLTSANSSTFLTLHNDVGSDLGTQKTFIDFIFEDDNDNDWPQVRIGAEVGQNSDANSQIKEGSGAFVVYTNNASTNNPGNPSNLAERFRVDYEGNTTATGSLRAPIFYDTTDTTYYANPSSISIFDRLRLQGTGLAGAATLEIDNPSTSAFIHTGELFTANMTAGQTNIFVIGKEGTTKQSGYIGYNWSASGSNNNYVSIGHWSADHLFRVYGDVITSQVSFRGSADVRGTLFYDTNDTTYYVNPASESKISKLWINNGGAGGVPWSSGFNQGSGSNYWNQIQDAGIARQRNFGTGGYDWFSSGAAQLMTLSNGGTLFAAADMRSPIFYDSANTAFYVDPSNGANGISANLHGRIQVGTFSNSQNNTGEAWIGRASDRSAGTLTIQLGGGAGRSFEVVDSGWTTVEFSANDSGVATAAGSFRAPIFYDSNDTAYYINPASTSRLNFANYGSLTWQNYSNSPTGKINVEVAGGNAINIYNTDENKAYLNFIDSQSDGTQYCNLSFDSGNNYFTLNNMGNNTMVVQNNGYTKLANDGDTTWQGYNFHAITNSSAGEPTLMVYNSASTGNQYGVNVVHKSTSANTTGRVFLGATNNGATERIKIYSNGNIQNSNNSYGQLSDVNLKENIVDATPKLDEINQVRIVNFNYIDDINEETNAPVKQIGVVAQELEEIFPGLVYECGDTEVPTKSVKYSVFVPMLIKAVQELTQEVQTLKNQINGIN